MTLAHSQPHAFQRLEITRISARPGVICECLWDISPSALLASPGAAMLNGHAAKLKSAALSIRVEQPANFTTPLVHATLVCELTDHTTDRLPMTPPHGVPCRITTDAATSLTLIDAEHTLSLTLRDKTILYARTPLLTTKLALPGGVYDVPRIA